MVLIMNMIVCVMNVMRCYMCMWDQNTGCVWDVNKCCVELVVVMVVSMWLCVGRVI